ncbi:hypothetical protein RJ639_019748 [Escallonia herrerae]|uniref:COI1 F-box domain-containing protein n=1 Tax=Escallonia herrerae TaxID=1293975 RepID=A0AA89AIZ4_9ASTE|nr:hypothetical protein RJ639_019748 [Escallonia herrerae]
MVQDPKRCNSCKDSASSRDLPEWTRPSPFPNEVLDRVLSLMESHKDQSSVSLVCKDWYNAERWSRSHVFIGNCYSISPKIIAGRSSLAMHSKKGGSFESSIDGAPYPIGHVIGWSFVDPTGNARLRNLSTMSRVKNGDSGFSISLLLRSDRTNPGWIGIAPASRSGLRSSFPARAATSCTMFPPELSPMRNTRLKSAL